MPRRTRASAAVTGADSSPSMATVADRSPGHTPAPASGAGKRQRQEEPDRQTANRPPRGAPQAQYSTLKDLPEAALRAVFTHLFGIRSIPDGCSDACHRERMAFGTEEREIAGYPHRLHPLVNKDSWDAVAPLSAVSRSCRAAFLGALGGLQVVFEQGLNADSFQSESSLVEKLMRRGLQIMVLLPKLDHLQSVSLCRSGLPFSQATSKTPR